MKKVIVIILIIISLFPINILAFDFKINSKEVILINLNEDKILYEKNINDKTYIASLTKIMTAVVVLDNISNIEDEVYLKEVDFKGLREMNAAVSGLKVNNKYSYKELLYALLLPSGADAANCLARNIGGDLSNFVKMMNEKAKELGMENTKFQNPIGLDDKNNYSTVYDLSILFKYALNNEDFMEIIKTMEYKTDDNVKLTHIISYYLNKYDIEMDYLIGGKTGYDTKAGYCLATIAESNDVNYMLITVNAPYSSTKANHFIDAKNIYEYYINNYGYQKIFSKNDILYEINTKYSKEDKYKIVAKQDYSYYLENDYDKTLIDIKYNGIEEISYKDKEKEHLGKLSIYYDDELLDMIDIYLDTKIDFNIFVYLNENKLVALVILEFIVVIILLIIYLIKKKKRKLIYSQENI